MEQATLFDGGPLSTTFAPAVSPLVENTVKGLYAAGDPKTSRLAAERMETSGARRRQVETVALELGRAQRRHGKNGMGAGLTSAELAVESGLDRTMIARRLPDAERHGLVRRMGVRSCAVNHTEAITWAVANQEL